MVSPSTLPTLNIVNTITRHVSSCGCNIEDSRLAMLGDE
ncbi:ACT domain-containing protein, partial [Escherichia fergusonii]